MTLHALDIPDDPVHLPVWLERQLVSFDLAGLVAELTAIHGTAPGGPSLDELLRNHRELVLASGLRRLPSHLLGYLLLRPQLLLELQELILSAGGDYWDELLPDSPEDRARISRGERRLEAFLADQKTGADAALRVLPGSGDAATHQTDSVRADSRRGDATAKPTWYRNPWIVSLATAAAVLFGVFVYDRTLRSAAVVVASAGTGWGWAKPGAIKDSLPADRYLSALAAAAEEWFDKRPDSATDLARRIGEFRQGCSILLLSDHKPLSATDRDWLKERCRLWAGKLEAHLASLEAGGDVHSVRREADDTIRKLVDALRTRSEKVMS